MSGAQLNACLVILLVVAVSVQYSYGAGEYDSNCTKSSDCKFDHGYCRKYDECKMGKCRCDSDHGYDFRMCMKMRKIGESCDLNYDRCYGAHSSCQGICACVRGYKASEDKKTCVGNKFGEPCYEYTNDNWDSQKCGFGLTCVEHACACSKNRKKVGDHCDTRNEGDTCDRSYDCYGRGYECVDNKCSCDKHMTEFTYKYHDYKGGENTATVCVSKEAKLGAAVNDKCTMTNTHSAVADKNDIVCGDYLTCDRCIESSNEWNNNTKMCLSGTANYLSMDMTVFGLVVLVLLLQLN